VNDINQTVNLETKDLSLRRDRRNMLKKAKSFGLSFTETELREAHRVIAKNRSDRGLPLSLTLPQLERVSMSLPGAIHAFEVSLDGNSLAASVVYRVTSELAYVFMWGHLLGQPQSSAAMTLLAEQTILTYQKLGFKKVCLGVSSEGGIENPGLIEFKESLGAYSEDRPVYEWISSS
jgi:hypothetical protein